MLALLRRKARSPVIQIAIVVIILVFIFWLPQMGGDGGPGTVAVVNDEPISTREFQRRYDDLLAQYRDQMGGVIPSELLEALGVREQVVNQLIQERLLLQSAGQTGLPVTRDEVRQAVHAMGEFSENGYFSLDVYRQTLAGARIGVQEFEGGLRTDLQRRKIVEHLVGFARVGEAEVRERFHRDHDQIRLSYLRLAVADFRAGISPTEEELNEYYQADAERYRGEARLRLDYLLFSPDGDSSLVVTEEQIAAYYRENHDLFNFPEQRRARHILIRSAAADSPELRENRREQLRGVLEQARAGRDFVELALLYSEDATATDGGDLGYFGRGEMVEPIEAAAFALRPGEISEVVETSFGFHLVKLEDIKSARQISLEEARQEIAQKLRAERGRQLAFARAGDVYEEVLTSGSLARGAEATGEKVRGTTLFKRSQPPAELARRQELVAAAFRLNQGELSSIVPTGDGGYAILFVPEREEPMIPPLAEIRARVAEDFINTRAREAARLAAEDTLAALTEGRELEAVAAELGQRVRQSGWFARATATTADLPSSVVEAGLRLSEKSPLPPRVQAADDHYYVIRLAERRPGDEGLFARWAEPIRAELLRAKQEALLDSWVKHLAGQADIRLTQGAF
ncbi:SurA N-terminal domain-containing protein [Desulfurivibrio sp. D14AmB]|uniref:peptidylprolyl isomerase n=1 Tax=Desulfurivibrio sp. D14AmB TaxID=3374370 RepID=UPI00376F1FEC